MALLLTHLHIPQGAFWRSRLYCPRLNVWSHHLLTKENSRFRFPSKTLLLYSRISESASSLLPNVISTSIGISRLCSKGFPSSDWSIVLMASTFLPFRISCLTESLRKCPLSKHRPRTRESGVYIECSASCLPRTADGGCALLGCREVCPCVTGVPPE